MYDNISKKDFIKLIESDLLLYVHLLIISSKDPNVLDYLAEMRSLWEELKSNKHMPNCICEHPCRCEVMRVAHNYRIEY